MEKVISSFVEDPTLPEIMAPFEKSANELTEVRKAMVPEYAGAKYEIPSAVFVSQHKNKRAEQLEDFDTFFPEGTKSELSKCLTKEIWEEYKDMSCEEQVTFKTCIFSGIANLDSGIGVYAGSHQSYT